MRLVFRELLSTGCRIGGAGLGPRGIPMRCSFVRVAKIENSMADGESPFDADKQSQMSTGERLCHPGSFNCPRRDQRQQAASFHYSFQDIGAALTGCRMILPFFSTQGASYTVMRIVDM